MLDTAIAATRDRKRLQEIASVLARAGLGGLLGWLAPAEFSATSFSSADGDESLTAPGRLRNALEQLGPVFIKLGQILSTRGDLLPLEWTRELEHLQANVPAISWSGISSEIVAALGVSPHDAFDEFDETPIAAASIAQVYRAKLSDGTPVAVKVRRPGLRPVVDADLRLLSHAATLAEKQSAELARFQPREIVRHLAAAIREELDLANEGRNCEAIAENFKSHPNVVIPRIHWEFTSDSLLVQDFVDGIAPARDGRIEDAGLDGKVLARRGAEAFLSMVLVDGLFHADPHPGNLLALPDNRIGFIDFGMIGRIGDKRRAQILSFVGAIVRSDADQVSSVLLEWSSGSDPDLGRLDAATDAFIARHGHGALDLSRAVSDIMALSRDNKLTLPPDLALLFKALATADGVMKRLDPDFEAVKAAAPLVRRAMLDRLNPAALRKRGESFAIDLFAAAQEFPSLVKLLIHRLRQGSIKADITMNGMEAMGQHIERAATRIAIAIVVAAFALGLAPELIRSGPVIYGIPVFAFTGVMAIVAGILWLLGQRLLKK